MFFGVGENDSTEKVSSNKNGVQAFCASYEMWKHMLARCYDKRSHKRQPTYVGCSVDSRWFKYSAFKEWYELQDKINGELDKDILVQGNKIYSPDLCVIIPRSLNLFLNSNPARRGSLPIGVTYSENLTRFKARCCNPFSGKLEHIGVFDTKEEAHEAWRLRKHAHSLRYASMQSDQRVAESLRVRYLTRGEA